MATEILVPELGESVVEATVARWLKSEGDRVSIGDALVELETEKVNLEVSAEKDGVLASIKRQEGEDVEVGSLLGTLEPAPNEPDQAGKKEGEHVSNEKAVDGAQDSAGGDERATPMAKRLAKEHGLDLANLSADNDRITKGDVERYLDRQEREQKSGKSAEKTAEKKEAAPSERAKEEEASPARPDQSGREERIRMSRRRQTIARRLVEAQQSAAMLTTFNEVDMSAVMSLRKRQQESFQARHGVKLGFMSFFVKAVIGALRHYPHLNAEIDGNEIVLKHYYDIGMAIGAPEGLVVPVIRNADRLTFADIEQTIGQYVEKSQSGDLSLEDLRGGTFTITNGGVFGSLLSTPILNPPQVGILGLHKIEKRPVVIDDQVAVRPMMYVALSYDHRIVDGREAVQFLVRLKTLVEEPETLLLEG